MIFLKASQFWPSEWVSGNWSVTRITVLADTATVEMARPDIARAAAPIMFTNLVFIILSRLKKSAFSA